MFCLWLQVMQRVQWGAPVQRAIDYSHLFKTALWSSMKVSFSITSMSAQWSDPEVGLMFSSRLREISRLWSNNVHHLAFPLAARLPPGLDLEFLYGEWYEGALLPCTLSTLLLLTYEDATDAGEWFITGCAPLAPSHISNVVRWGGVLSSVCTWTLWTR